MKEHSIIPLHFITAVNSRLCKGLFLLLAMSTIYSVKAYAEVENCPDPASIRFDKPTYKWITTERGWKSNSRPRNFANLGDVTLKLVKVKIDHKEGDVASCSYDAANGENVVFDKGGSAKDSSGSIIHSEIIPIGDNEWSNKDTKDEFVCQPSSTSKCAFDVVVSLPGTDKSHAANILRPVRLYFALGTAFVAHACGNGPEGIACVGPMHVNGVYFLKHNTPQFCVEVNSFAGVVWYQYYFQLDENYEGETMKWWGASVDPQFTVPKGIRHLTTNVSGNYTGCGFLNLTN